MDNNIDPKSRETVDERIKADKEIILDDLRKAPFVFIAVKNAARDKSTFYRWLRNDKDFAKNVIQAKKEGAKNLHEKAFSVLAKEGTTDGNWRPALELMKYLDRMSESGKERVPPTLLSVLSDSKSLSVLSEILKIASDNLDRKETGNK